jgi:L-ascorbate metabolism protein UlaG (beta-lactamase superfamily)
MDITWNGHSCFRITERGMASVVTDPYDHKLIGYQALNLKANILTVSHDEPGHNFVKSVKGNEWEIRGAGEYEIGGVFITAVATQNEESTNMVFVFDYGGVTVGHMGDMSKVPSRSQVEALGSVDVALVPVGGGNALNAAKAAEVISLIEPGIVIPMHYKTPASKLELNSLKQFLREMGLSANEESLPSLKVTQSSIPEETRVVVLEAPA